MKNHYVNVLPLRNRYLCIYVRYGEMGQFRINLEKVWHDTMNKKRNNYHARTGPAKITKFHILLCHARNRRQRSDVVNAFV